MANSGLSLDLLAKSINTRLQKGDEMLISAVQEMLEAQSRLEAGEREGWDWPTWRKLYITTPWPEIQKRLGMAGARGLLKEDVSKLLGSNIAARGKIASKTRPKVATPGAVRGRPKGAVTKVAEAHGIHRETVRRALQEPETWRQEFTRLWKRASAADRAWARIEIRVKK